MKSAFFGSAGRLLVDFLVVGAAAWFLMRESEAPNSRVASFAFNTCTSIGAPGWPQ
jgi:hypothetical protein